MKKSKRYTLCVCVLSFLVVFGGWFVTAGLLKQREAKFLAGMGAVELQSSQIALFAENGSQGEAQRSTPESVKEAFRGMEMAERTRMLVLCVWEYGGSEQPHEPREGQMNMEQAIDAGRDWIRSVAGYGNIPSELANCDFDKTSATLCTIDSQLILSDLEDLQLSYWTVRFAGSDSTVTLKIHAASGEVWRAQIASLLKKGIVETNDLDSLLDIAFPFMTEGKELKKIWNDLEKNTIYQTSDEGMVYTALRQYTIYYSEELDGAALMTELWLCTGE